MSESTAPPLSPTVATVFSNFLKRLESEKIADAETIERVRNALNEQNLDPESLRAALFDSGPKNI
jgi:hypothetical protein